MVSSSDGEALPTSDGGQTHRLLTAASALWVQLSSCRATLQRSKIDRQFDNGVRPSASQTPYFLPSFLHSLGLCSTTATTALLRAHWAFCASSGGDGWVAGRGSQVDAGLTPGNRYRIAQNPSGGQERRTTSNETKRARGGKKKKVAGDVGSLTRWHRVKMGTESKISKRRVSSAIWHED